jgi:hypothetical protein
MEYIEYKIQYSDGMGGWNTHFITKCWDTARREFNNASSMYPGSKCRLLGTGVVMETFPAKPTSKKEIAWVQLLENEIKHYQDLIVDYLATNNYEGVLRCNYKIDALQDFLNDRKAD